MYDDSRQFFDIKHTERVFQVVNVRQYSTIRKCSERTRESANVLLDSRIKIHLPFDDYSKLLLKGIFNYLTIDKKIRNNYKSNLTSGTVYLGSVPISVERIINKIASSGCLKFANLLKHKMLSVLKELGRDKKILRETSIYFPVLIKEKR